MENTENIFISKKTFLPQKIGKNPWKKLSYDWRPERCQCRDPQTSEKKDKEEGEQHDRSDKKFFLLPRASGRVSRTSPPALPR